MLFFVKERSVRHTTIFCISKFSADSVFFSSEKQYEDISTCQNDIELARDWCEKNVENRKNSQF